MGTQCLNQSSRHSATRDNHLQALQESGLSQPIDFIIGANSDVTSAIEMHRQALREGGFVQPPAPTETIRTIRCPVNLRKDSVRLTKVEDDLLTAATSLTEDESMPKHKILL